MAITASRRRTTRASGSSNNVNANVNININNLVSKKSVFLGCFALSKPGSSEIHTTTLAQDAISISSSSSSESSFDGHELLTVATNQIAQPALPVSTTRPSSRSKRSVKSRDSPHAVVDVPPTRNSRRSRQSIDAAISSSSYATTASSHSSLRLQPVSELRAESSNAGSRKIGSSGRDITKRDRSRARPSSDAEEEEEEEEEERRFIKPIFKQYRPPVSKSSSIELELPSRMVDSSARKRSAVLSDVSSLYPSIVASTSKSRLSPTNSTITTVKSSRSAKTTPQKPHSQKTHSRSTASARKPSRVPLSSSSPSLGSTSPELPPPLASRAENPRPTIKRRLAGPKSIVEKAKAEATKRERAEIAKEYSKKATASGSKPRDRKGKGKAKEIDADDEEDEVQEEQISDSEEEQEEEGMAVKKPPRRNVSSSSTSSSSSSSSDNEAATSSSFSSEDEISHPPKPTRREIEANRWRIAPGRALLEGSSRITSPVKNRNLKERRLLQAESSRSSNLVRETPSQADGDSGPEMFGEEISPEDEEDIGTQGLHLGEEVERHSVRGEEDEALLEMAMMSQQPKSSSKYRLGRHMQEKPPERARQSSETGATETADEEQEAERGEDEQELGEHHEIEVNLDSGKEEQLSMRKQQAYKAADAEINRKKRILPTPSDSEREQPSAQSRRKQSLQPVSRSLKGSSSLSVNVPSRSLKKPGKVIDIADSSSSSSEEEDDHISQGLQSHDDEVEESDELALRSPVPPSPHQSPQDSFTLSVAKPPLRRPPSKHPSISAPPSSPARSEAVTPAASGNGIIDRDDVSSELSTLPDDEIPVEEGEDTTDDDRWARGRRGARKKKPVIVIKPGKKATLKVSSARESERSASPAAAAVVPVGRKRKAQAAPASVMRKRAKKASLEHIQANPSRLATTSSDSLPPTLAQPLSAHAQASSTTIRIHNPQASGKSHETYLSFIAGGSGPSLAQPAQFSSAPTPSTNGRSVYTRSRTNAPEADTSQCHLCECFEPKNRSFHCITCERAICDSCLVSEYTSIPAYRALIALMCMPMRVPSAFGQHQQQDEGMRMDSSDNPLSDIEPTSQKNSPNYQRGSRQDSRKSRGRPTLQTRTVQEMGILDTQFLDFQCPVCKGRCPCANCLRGPYHKGVGGATSSRGTPLPPRMTAANPQNYAPLPSNQDGFKEKYNHSDQAVGVLPRHARVAGQPTPTMSARKRPRRYAPNQSMVDTDVYYPNLDGDGYSSSSSDSGIVVVASQKRRSSATFNPTSRIQTVQVGGGQVPRLGSPPIHHSAVPALTVKDVHDEQDHETVGYGGGPLVRTESTSSAASITGNVPTTSARVRIATKVGQQLGKSPANLLQAACEAARWGDAFDLSVSPHEPVFTLTTDSENDRHAYSASTSFSIAGFALHRAPSLEPTFELPRADSHLALLTRVEEDETSTNLMRSLTNLDSDEHVLPERPMPTVQKIPLAVYDMIADLSKVASSTIPGSSKRPNEHIDEEEDVIPAFPFSSCLAIANRNGQRDGDAISSTTHASTNNIAGNIPELDFHPSPSDTLTTSACSTTSTLASPSAIAIEEGLALTSLANGRDTSPSLALANDTQETDSLFNNDDSLTPTANKRQSSADVFASFLKSQTCSTSNPSSTRAGSPSKGLGLDSYSIGGEWSMDIDEYLVS